MKKKRLRSALRLVFGLPVYATVLETQQIFKVPGVITLGFQAVKRTFADL